MIKDKVLVGYTGTDFYGINLFLTSLLDFLLLIG